MENVSMTAPKRELFRAAEVCEVAEVQPYVLRSWDAEFPRLGHVPPSGGPRVYTRVDIELVLRIKQMVYGEGLTLAGARRRLAEEEAEPADGPMREMEDVFGEQARDRLRRVRDGLQGIMQLLTPVAPGELELVAPATTTKRGGRAGEKSRSQARR